MLVFKLMVGLWVFFGFIGLWVFIMLISTLFFKDRVYTRFLDMLKAERELKELNEKYQKLQSRVEKLQILLGGNIKLPEVEYPMGALPIYVEECDTPCALPAVGPIVRGADSNLHTGLDIDVPESTFVFSTAKGVIKDVGRDKNLGLFVKISHSKGYETVYGHLLKVFVKVGDTVKTGQIIGLSGSTGKTSGPHIHYEVWKNGKPIDPVSILP
ncbi:MAG: M23 family metallopeptidase [candidate division WOR-3 bacterium]